MTPRITIIGAGPGGIAAAQAAARAGAEVTVVEKENPGGVCLNRGCIPSKFFRTAAGLLTAVKKRENFGIVVDGGTALDLAMLQTRNQHLLAAQRQAIVESFRRHGVRLLRGQALLKETGRVTIKCNAQAPEEITWDKLIIAAGSSPAALPFAPFDGQVVLSSTDLLNLTKVPASMIIIGAGAIGCEFACILRAFGAEVTMVEGLDRVLPVESVDAECSKTLERELKKQKIRILTRTMISRIERTGSGVRVVAGAAPLNSQPARDKETFLEIEAEAVLVCIGRRPSRHGLDFALLGIETDGQGWIRVDNRLQTSHPDVFAIGDILGPGRPMLAHVASAEGEVAAVNAMGGNRLMTYDAVPLGVYSMPEVACVGVSEAAARRQGLDVLTGSALFRTVGLAQVIGDIAGLAKIVAEKDSGRIVGVHLIGPHATELIGEATLAVRNSITIQELTQTIHAHPTLSEVIYEAARMMNENPRS